MIALSPEIEINQENHSEKEEKEQSQENHSEEKEDNLKLKTFLKVINYRYFFI